MSPHTTHDDSQSQASHNAASAAAPKEDLRVTAYRAGANARATVDHVVADMGQFKEKVEEEIHKNPLRSSLLALGAGVLAGLLLTR